MSALDFLRRLTGTTSPVPEASPEPMAVDASVAREACAAAEIAHKQASTELAALTAERDQAVEALRSAESAYVANPLDPSAVRAAKECLELVTLRFSAALECEKQANTALDNAKAAVDDAVNAARLADARKRADLTAFHDRQGKRAARMCELQAELNALAEASDEDFFAVNDAGVEAGLGETDRGHLLIDLLADLPVDADTFNNVRLARRFDVHKRTCLAFGVEQFVIRPPRGMAATGEAAIEAARQDMETLRSHRDFRSGRAAVEEKRRERARAAAEAFAKSPEEIARKAAWQAEQERLSRMPPTNHDPFAGYRTAG